MSVTLQRHSMVRELLRPNPRDAAEQRLAVRKAAGRIIRAYKLNQDIAPGDAVVCAVGIAQLIDILERAAKYNGEKRARSSTASVTK